MISSTSANEVKKNVEPSLLTPSFGPGQVVVESKAPLQSVAEIEWRNRPQDPVLRILPKADYMSGGLRVALPIEPVAGKPHWLISLEMKSHAEAGPSGQVGMEVQIAERNSDTGEFKMLFAQPATVGPDWETVTLHVRFEEEWPLEHLHILLRPLYFTPVTEVSGLSVRALAEKPEAVRRLVYPGQEADAEWRGVARENIMRHRAGPLAVEIIDHLGNPVENAGVAIQQQRHGYPFGTAVVAKRIADGDRDLLEDDSSADIEVKLADNERYRDKLNGLFNYVVFENDLKWPLWEREGTHFRQDWTQDALEWLNRQNLLVKGHTLIWGSWEMTPKWLRQFEKDPDALQARILAHIEDVGTATRDHVDHWDVLNEPLSHRNIIEIVGMDRVAEWFKKAREVMPDVKLFINDFDIIGNNGSPNRQEAFYAFISDLLERGAPIDAIGFQSHFWSTRLTPPTEIWKVIDQYEQLGLELYVTEFDTNFPDEAVQAAYTKDFLTAWFGHPATDGFIMWGFYARAHWFGEAGALYRRDWEPKPNAVAYKHLLFSEWWTDEQTRTNALGKAAFRPFFGRHEIRVEADGYPAVRRLIEHVPEGPATLRIILPPTR